MAFLDSFLRSRGKFTKLLTYVQRRQSSPNRSVTSQLFSTHFLFLAVVSPKQPPSGPTHSPRHSTRPTPCPERIRAFPSIDKNINIKEKKNN